VQYILQVLSANIGSTKTHHLDERSSFKGFLQKLRSIYGRSAYQMRTLYFGFVHVSSSFFFLSSFFPRLIFAIAEWMSTILVHMMWPWCEVRMQVLNVLQAAQWKYSTPE